jgi:hypothetical protein
VLLRVCCLSRGVFQQEHATLPYVVDDGGTERSFLGTARDLGGRRSRPETPEQPMKKSQVSLSRLERVAVAIQHAEVLADEANDARCFEIADRLRLHAARLAIELEQAENSANVVDEARGVRRQRAERLRQLSAVLDVELEERLSPEDAAGLVVGMRASAESVTRFRLKRLTDPQRAILGSVVDDCERALLELEAADDRLLDATAQAFVNRVRVIGRAHVLRRQMQRDKAVILSALPLGSADADRVRRYVVRTRIPEAFGWRMDQDLAEPTAR